MAQMMFIRLIFVSKNFVMVEMAGTVEMAQMESTKAKNCLYLLFLLGSPVQERLGNLSSQLGPSYQTATPSRGFCPTPF